MSRLKTIHEPKYKAFINEIVKIRNSKGLSQRALADRIHESAAFVATIEIRERRMDVLETYKILKGLGLSKSEISKLLEKYFY